MPDFEQLRDESRDGTAKAEAESIRNNAEAVARAEAQRQARETPLGQADEAATRWMAGVDTLVRDVWTPITWVRYTGLGQVLTVNKSAGWCTVALPSDVGAPPAGRQVRIGAGSPKVGKTYPVYESYGMSSPEHSLLEGPTPLSLWLHAPVGKWLYYATDITTDPNDGDGYAYGISRIPWPPTDATAVEHLCILQSGTAGWELRAFIGVDGFGNVWYRLRQPGGHYAVMFFRPDDWTSHSSPIPTGGVQALAVDSTPGQCHLAGTDEIFRDESYSTAYTPLLAIGFSNWLHLQSDGGTTFHGGNPPPSYGFQGTPLRTTDASVNPATVGSNGYYQGPNDGTSAAPHYHWFVINDTTTPAPFNITVSDTYRESMSVYLGTVALSGLSASVTMVPRALRQIFGPWVIGDWGERPFSGPYRPAYLASESEAVAAVLASGSMSAAWGTSRILPSILVHGPLGRPQYHERTGSTVHVWTRLDGEGNAGDVEVAVSFAAISNPSYFVDRAGVPNAGTVIWPAHQFNVPGLTLAAMPRPYWPSIDSIGPSAPSGYRGLGSGAVDHDHVVTTTDIDRFRLANGAWSSLGFRYNTVFADGRDALDVMIDMDGSRHNYQYTEDGGETWQAVPITLPFYPGGQYPRLRNGYIVEV